jgi:hypothetical protein
MKDFKLLEALDEAANLEGELFGEHKPSSPTDSSVPRSADVTEHEIPGPRATKMNLPPGFITQYVEAALRSTDAPPEAHALVAVLLLSAFAGPGPKLPVANRIDSGTRLTLWGMNLVDSTEGRKTTVINMGLHIIRSVLGDDAVMPWKSSPEALIQRGAKRDGQACVRGDDEYAGVLLGIKKGGYLSDFAQNLIKMYDGARIEMARTAKMNRNTGQRVEDSDYIHNPYLVQISAATYSRFIQVATEQELLDGHLTRFIFTSGTATAKPMQRWTDAHEQAWAAVVKTGQRLHAQAQDVLTVQMSENRLVEAFAIEQAFVRMAQSSPRPDAARPTMKRLADSLLTVAGLLALERAEAGAVEMSAVDLEAALALSGPWQAATLKVVEDVGRTQHQMNCDNVLATVNARNGITHRELFRAHRRLKGPDFKQVVDDLLGQGLIVRTTDRKSTHGGHDVHRYYPSQSAVGPE